MVSSARSTVLLSAVSNFALPASALITGPILARTLGVEGRGELAALSAPIVFAGYLFTLGIPESMVFHTASRIAPLRDARRAAMAGGFVAGVLAFVAVYFMAPVLLARTPELVWVMRLVGITLPFTIAVAAMRGVIQGLKDFRSIIAERWISVLSRLATISGLALFGVLTPLTALVATQLTSLLGSLAILIALLRTRARPDTPPPPAPLMRIVGSYAIRSWIGSLSTLLIVRLDQVVMVPLTSSRELALYVVAVSLAELPVSLFSAVRDVVFSRSASGNTTEDTALIVRVIVALYIPLSLVFFIVSPIVLSGLFGREFTAAAPIVNVLWVGSLFSGVASICGATLLGMGKPGRFSVVQVAVAVVNVAFLLLLLPPYGALGAAIATLAAYLLFALAVTISLSRSSGVRFNRFWLIRRGDLRTLLRPGRRVIEAG